MATIYHPVGNKKILLIKKCKKILRYIILLILSFFLKINLKKNEIIISTALYAPWREDKNFCSFYDKIKKLHLTFFPSTYSELSPLTLDNL